MPDSTIRPVDPKYSPRPDAHTTFADAYPVLLTNAASLDALNTNLPAPLGMERFRANVVVTGAPAQQWDVQLELHQLDASMSSAYALVAKCKDGLTCNNLAAMYKAAVKSATPQVGCGATPASFGAQIKIVDILPGGVQANLPDEVIGKCARLGACSARKDPTGTKDVAIECQKAPSSFDLTCAMKANCDEVASCLSK